MSREEFYEWLNGCKCNYVYEKDDYGLINITFFPIEIEENEDEFIDFDKMNNSQKLAFLIERNGYIEDGTGLNEYGHEFRDDNGLALFIDERENEDE